MKKNFMKSMAMGALLLSVVACNGGASSSQATAVAGEQSVEQNASETVNSKNSKEMKYSKKYTNADFYKDGKFQQDVAMEAMKDMFAFYGVPFTDLMAKDMWVNRFWFG